MDRPRPCGCKGRRSCLICEKQYNIKSLFTSTSLNKENGYVYCYLCNQAVKGWDNDPCNIHPNHEEEKISFNGVYVEYNFLDEFEKEKLLKGINNEQWTLSQSGRRKQNYGPKCNFKKQKIQKKDFFGFPEYSEFVHNKFKNISFLNDFQVVEQCVLEYDHKRGASIDPHIDDCWIWGERIVTVNVLGNTFLTMTKYTGNKNKYNLHCTEKYNPNFTNSLNNIDNTFKTNNDPIVRIFMPEKSLIVLYGNARYEWEHSVLREDITDYRICIAYREFTPPYLSGEHEIIGNEILELSKNYW